MSTQEVTVSRVSPLSAFRTALALSLAALAAWILCVTLLYYGLEQFGFWAKLNSIVTGVGGSDVITFGTVLSVASLLGAVTAIAVTILAPLTAVIYNGMVELFGGVVVTLNEGDY